MRERFPVAQTTAGRARFGGMAQVLIVPETVDGLRTVA
jgi:hypothetical protein